MTAELRESVRNRAQFRCEYCRLPERLLPSHRFERGSHPSGEIRRNFHAREFGVVLPAL
jgi:hypothetical protein